MRLPKIIFVTGLLLLFGQSSLAATESPEKIVKDTVDAILTVLGDEQLSEDKKREQVFELARQRINFLDMSRRILARNWSTASEKQKAEFQSLFETILLNSYWIRIKNYAGERIEYIAATYDREDVATVDTIIVRGDDIQIPISYRMKRFVDIWFAYDFVVEQLSLVQNYRSEYAAIVKNEGLDGLLLQMQQEVADLNVN